MSVKKKEGACMDVNDVIAMRAINKRPFKFEIQKGGCQDEKRKRRCKKCDQYEFCPFSPKNRRKPIISAKGEDVENV